MASFAQNVLIYLSETWHDSWCFHKGSLDHFGINQTSLCSHTVVCVQQLSLMYFWLTCSVSKINKLKFSVDFTETLLRLFVWQESCFISPSNFSASQMQHFVYRSFKGKDSLVASVVLPQQLLKVSFAYNQTHATQLSPL